MAELSATDPLRAGLAARTPAGGLVLVVGWGDGELPAVLADRATRSELVVVVADEASAAAAHAAGRTVVLADLGQPGAGPAVLAQLSGRRAEAIVALDAVVTARRTDVVLAACAELLEPAGVLLAAVPAGLQAAGTAPLRAVVQALDGAGWTTEQLEPVLADGARDPVLRGTIVSARPPWTPDALMRAGVSVETGVPGPAAVRVLVLGETDPSLLVALRASLPERTTLAPLDLDDDLAPDQAILVLTPDVLPQPGWVQALLDGLDRHACPVGVRLVDEAGTVVHAGAADDGAAFAAGVVDADHALLAADRPAATLLPPFAARASDLASDGPVRGRYLGARAAISIGVAAAPTDGRDVGLDEVFPDVALVVSTSTPRRWAAADRAGFQAVVDALLAQGTTPVVHWAETTPVAARGALHDLERMGVVLVGGSAAEAATEPHPLVARPDPYALVRTLRPRLVAYADAPAMDQHLGLCLHADARGARMVLCSDPAGVADGTRTADIVAPWRTPGLAERVVDLLAEARTTTAPRVAPIPVRERRAGVVSVVIPVWNGWELTRRCLASLAAHAEAPLEVIVVDNGSTDATPGALAARAADGSLVVHTNEENLGFPVACNQGMRLATGELVCVLNNDTEVTPGWLAEMVAALARPGTGMVGPRSNRISGSQAVGGAPAIDPAEDVGEGTAHAWASTWAASRTGRSWQTGRLVGFCLLLRGDLLEELGGFDEAFGTGNYEDDDLCRRVLQSGRTLRVADGSVVLHRGGATFEALGTSYGVMVTEARRHHRTTEGRPTARLLAGIVLSDGDPVGAARAAALASRLVDVVRVVERRGVATTRLAVASAFDGAEVVAAGHDDLAVVVAGLPHDRVLVLHAGELVGLDDDDWGAARAAVEDWPDRLVPFAAAEGIEVRAVPVDRVALALVGTPAPAALPGVRLHRSIEALNVARDEAPAPRPPVVVDAPTSPAPAPPAPGPTAAGPTAPAVAGAAPSRGAAPAPLVSIFTSVKDGGRWLPTYLASTTGQTFPDLEIVVWDNGSTDGTSEVLDAAAARHPRLRVFRDGTDLGMDDGFRRVFSLTRGRFTKLLSIDDALVPTCVERLVQPLLAHPELVLATSARDKIDEHGTVTPRDWVCFDPIVDQDGAVGGRAFGDLMLTTCMNWLGEGLFRKDLVDAERIFTFGGRGYPSAGDVALSLDLLRQGDAWFVVDRLSRFRVHGGQDGATFRRTVADSTSWVQLIHTGIAEGFLADPVDRRTALVTALERAVQTYGTCRSELEVQRGVGAANAELTALAEAIALAGSDLAAWEASRGATIGQEVRA